MSMQTYPLEEANVILLTRPLAAAVMIQDYWKNQDMQGMLPEQIRENLSNGATPWQCANDPSLHGLITDGDWDSLSDAYDILNAGEDEVDGLVYCSDFTGSACVKRGETVRYDSEYMVLVRPLRAADFFKAAYASMDELIREYQARLEPKLGPGVPYADLIADISGTYFC